jgi:hypothetical protein
MRKQELVTLHIPKEVSDELQEIADRLCFGKWTQLARRILTLYVREQNNKGGNK